jgi:hypothetical protein
VFTPNRVWIKTLEGKLVEERHDPRASFAGHVRATKWDELHRLYFLGYASWNYLTTPFLFAQPGFELGELAPHKEDGEEWRVLRVRFPAAVPTHCEEQLFYFSAEGMLKRYDHKTDVAGGAASHYPYDPQDDRRHRFPHSAAGCAAQAGRPEAHRHHGRLPRLSADRRSHPLGRR